MKREWLKCLSGQPLWSCEKSREGSRQSSLLASGCEPASRCTERATETAKESRQVVVYLRRLILAACPTLVRCSWGQRGIFAAPPGYLRLRQVCGKLIERSTETHLHRFPSGLEGLPFDFRGRPWNPAQSHRRSSVMFSKRHRWFVPGMLPAKS